MACLYLLELKEIFFSQLLVPEFTSKLALAKTYTWKNMEDIINDTTTFANLFVSNRIWSHKYLQTASTGKNVKFENITSDDITNLKQFNTYASDTWEELAVYHFVKQDKSKLDFIGIFTDFTDDLLNDIIDTQSSYEHEAASFFSVDLVTVNHYFIKAILDAKANNDTEFLNTYSIL